MTVEAISFALRTTARISAVLFLLAFVAAPLASIWPRAVTLARREGSLLVALAVSHTLHLMAIAAAAAKVGPARFVAEGGAGLILGALIYAAVYTAAFIPKLRGPALYPIWIGFLGGFLPKASQSVIHAGFCAALMAAMVLRIVAVVKRRQTGPRAKAVRATS